MIYIDIEKAIYGQLRDEEFTVRVATSLEDNQKLIEAGFECVAEKMEPRFAGSENSLQT